ncbi:MAG: energy-coupling factor transport system substrate-specific component [Solirubrobacterales bacterium]|jgi:energy-coupling factor transport system substrate-specific component|nr:energy-coupling factor transport system substrate-specific component [Solirubrobacterales bacterium]
MSWQLTSFLILAAVLLGGFAWYERSRPPSQVVALVAALAALAIAGRIAFAAFPNVKPTTDIVVFAGYALGPAPGFVVGALAGLVSNFWFGQGPWTPWQMAGWGMCGILGAALALGVRNAGRFSLAAVCGLAGIAYGLLLNFSLMATYGGDLSFERFLTLEARAIPFDVAHVVGNIAFALIAGPAMVRMLVRFRQRFQWRTPALAATILAALLILPALVPGSAQAAATDRAANWLEAAQNGDGGFGSSPGGDSSAALTGWAMLGLEAAGRNPFDVTNSGRGPIDFLRGHLDEVSSPGDLARTIVALEGAGADPRSFAGRDLISALLKRRAANGSYVGWPGTTSFSVIALRAAGAEGGLDGTVSWLGGVQNGDGGWGDVPGQPSNADVTGSVMQALPDTKTAQGGLSYLRKHQRSDGGFALGAAGGVNSQSTAWAVQGMIAVGADPATISSSGSSALDYLAARQAGDGHYRYSESKDQTPVWVTGQVLVAVAGNALPISPPPRESTPTEVSPSKAVPPPPTGGTKPTPGFESVPPPSIGTGTGGAGVPTAPPATGAVPAPPSQSGGVVPEGSEPEVAESAPAQGAGPLTASDDAPSPWAPIGIGLAATALAIGLPWWLGRRFAW